VLNWAAWKAGRDAARGRVDREEAREKLREAALNAGLSEHETAPTIRSGLQAGERVA
jgi:hypothetical protein